MPFDPATPHPLDALTLQELSLYHAIMDYRADNGLGPIPLSEALTTTAGRHTADTLYNIWQPDLTLPSGANLHSWSDAPYYGDHRDPGVMWFAPERYGITYPSHGFEISAAGYGSIEAALSGWKSSSGHNAVILNEGGWAGRDWTAIGIGVGQDGAAGGYGGRVYHVWFGSAEDPAGSPTLRGTASADRIDGTEFRDRIEGGRGSDRLYGDKGRDVITGNGGRDRIDGDGGSDRLTGGRGADSFIFDDANFGRDRITDFSDADRIHLTGPGEAASFAAFRAAAREKGGDVVYDLGNDGQNVIRLKSVSLDDLSADQFLFG
jgi:Ca2+-binding RTX toxin-like protein